MWIGEDHAGAPGGNGGSGWRWREEGAALEWWEERRCRSDGGDMEEDEPEARLVNEYGPTETVVGCVVYEIRRVGEGSGRADRETDSEHANLLFGQ